MILCQVTDLHHVSNNQVWTGSHTEGVAVNDLCRHPAAVDEGLDGSPAFNTEHRGLDSGGSVGSRTAHLMASWVQVLFWR